MYMGISIYAIPFVEYIYMYLFSRVLEKIDIWCVGVIILTGIPVFKFHIKIIK